MDGATSNFVGVQNSFETAEADSTGAWGPPGQSGSLDERATALLQSHHRQEPWPATSWAIKAKRHGVHQGIHASTFSLPVMSRQGILFKGPLARWGFPLTLR